MKSKSKIVFTILLIIGIILIVVGFFGFIFCAHRMTTVGIAELKISPTIFIIPFIIGGILTSMAQGNLRKINLQSKQNEQMQTGVLEQNNISTSNNQNLPTKCPNCNAPTNNSNKCEYCGTILTNITPKENAKQNEKDKTISNKP